MVKKKIDTIVEKIRQHEKDTGSVEVQIVALTADISELHEHCQQNPKDFSCQHGLLKKVNQRKRFLDYLKRCNEPRYKDLIKELGLRK